MLTSTVATLYDNAGHGEDHYVIRILSDQAFLDAVMDGVTGRRGWEASQALAEALNTAPVAAPADLIALLEEVNQQLYRRGWGRFLLSTISAALFVDGMLYVIGAGDSPIIHIRSDTSQLLSSRISGFSPLGPPRAIGVNQRLGNLHRAEVLIEPGDRVVLATDGVIDTVPRDELVALIRAAASPAAAVEQLQTLLTTRHAQAQGGSPGQRDDWTAIVRFFSTTT
jgi:serine/threonine protein phosphatase PrpC